MVQSKAIGCTGFSLLKNTVVLEAKFSCTSFFTSIMEKE
jgi:hypothetical protein